MLLTWAHANLAAIQQERVAALDDEEPLVELVDVLGGHRVPLDGPEGHLAAVHAVEDVALDAGRVLRGRRDAVRGALHEGGEGRHRVARVPEPLASATPPTMWFVIAVPDLGAETVRQIEAVRARHDPMHGVVPPHVTLVFGTERLTMRALVEHVEATATLARPFGCAFPEVRVVADLLSPDCYVFLVADQGREECVRLHDALYRGPLEADRRADVPFVPHMTLGRAASRDEAERIAGDVRAGGIEAAGLIDRLLVVEVDGARLLQQRQVALGPAGG